MRNSHAFFLMLLVQSIAISGLTASVAQASVFEPPGNFHTVDQKVLRGAKLTEGNLGWLNQNGVKTIIKLDDENEEEFKWGDTFGVEVHSHHINKFGLNLSFQLVTAILNDIIKSSQKGSVYIHCEYGSDRTGLVVAMYRIVTGWSKERAIAEMNSSELGHSSLQIWIDAKADEYGSRLERIFN